MNRLLTRLLRASQWGATMVVFAGVTTNVGCTQGGGGGEGGGGGAGGGEGGGGPQEVKGPNGDPLETLPELTCEGMIYPPDNFGYHGQCCYEVHCATAINSVCATPSEAALTNLPPGSGECECGTRSGPFATNDPMVEGECCYLVGSIGCDGRPLMLDGSPRVASLLQKKGAWSATKISLNAGEANKGGSPRTLTEGALRIAALSAPETIRAQIGERWAERAQFEHASVASFARFSMALLACGAPPALINASHQAAMDEVRHAQIALAIASAYCETSFNLGQLDIRGAFDSQLTLVDIAVATVVEGCVGETLAAIEVAESAQCAMKGPVQDALFAIAEDETRHAELSWAFVRWALGVGDSRLKQQVKAAFVMAFEKALSERLEGDDLPGAELHGVLPANEVMNLRRKAIDEVLRPAAQALFVTEPGENSLKPILEQVASLS